MLIYARFHGRGGQGIKTASRILGNAAHLEGYFTQDFPVYGAERRGAPIVAFTKITDEPSTMFDRGYILNPNLILIADDSLLDDPIVNPLAGLQSNGTVFINTSKSIDRLTRDRCDIRLVTEDLIDLSLKYVGRTILSTGLGSIAAKLTGIIRWSSVEEGVKEELLEIGIKGEILEKNIIFAKVCFERVYPSPLPIPKIVKSSKIVTISWLPPPITIPEVRNIGNTEIRKTGNWRIFKPIINLEKCNRCGLCVVYCPEGVVVMNSEGPEIKYDNCKGCLICFNECPVKAIGYLREVETS
ncbi:MAG: 2-oxoacid:acceptor oxidoreductase family protein [Aigarchaeota archaeon]|nr:2-oxoacid:acceptor oxidoreductase family protein [Aigarchaeota archaeon]MCX8193174.1 2-oxoacid:acceptor oxidoreductase family protein [Nitrososphaeria archaeon]MDW7986315.1 2-oxoacid:acceptor oxidoreductase family protein [Nitrososphaerota archaeon]